MTREDIIRMARECGSEPHVFEKSPGLNHWLFNSSSLERFAALVAEREREECAKVCDDQAMNGHTYDMTDSAEKCAAAIRARSEK